MAARFTEIDDLTREAHFYLTPTDECFYLRDYVSRGGFTASETNDLMLNFKKEVDRIGRTEWQYKEAAVRKFAAEFQAAGATNGNMTWVPIPPSKAKSHPLYDDRLLLMLRIMGQGVSLDVRELIVQSGTLRSSHATDDRLRPEELAAAYSIDESLAEPVPAGIVVFDDILTTGAHFKAAKELLRQRFTEARIIGVFIARVIRK